MTDQVSIFIGTVVPDGPPSAMYAVDFTDQTQVVILGSVHNLQTADLIIQLYETIPGDPLRYGLQGIYFVNQYTYDVNINFPLPQSGRCIIR